MSLQVWLPLIRDLNNQGLSSATPAFNANNSSIVANGKIGSCLKTAAVGEIDTNCNVNINTSSLSFGGWYKFNKAEIQAVIDTKTYTSTNKISTGNLIGNDSYGGIGLIFTTNNLYTNNKVLTNLDVFSTLRTATVNQSTSSKTIDFDVWTHLFTVWDRDTLTLSFYVNGSLFNSKTFSTFSDATTRNLFINYTHIYGGNGVAISPPSYVNDLRIYNHALSAKEVKLLSQGLVAHYTLGDRYLEGTTNLVTSLTQGGQTTISGNSVTTSGKNKDTYFTIKLSESIVSGTQYTISCYAEGIPDDSSWTFPLGAQSNTSLSWVIHNGYNAYTFTANSIDWGTNQLFMDDISRTFYGITKFSNFQLEKKDHTTGYAGMGGTRNDTTVYDCSGYNYHGTINTAMTVSSNTARYSVSTNFDGDGNSILIPFNSMLGVTAASKVDYTFVCWIYVSEISAKSGATILGGPSGFELETKNGSSATASYYAYSWGKGKVTYSLNAWHQIAMVHSVDDAKFYLDGELAFTGTSANIPIGNFYIGAWKNVTSQNYKGLVSDARIYATALSADDVKELYQTSASIDKDGNLYAYELKEE